MPSSRDGDVHIVHSSQVRITDKGAAHISSPVSRWELSVVSRVREGLRARTTGGDDGDWEVVDQLNLMVKNLVPGSATIAFEGASSIDSQPDAEFGYDEYEATVTPNNLSVWTFSSQQAMGSIQTNEAGHTAESTRKVIVAGAQLGPINVDTPRSEGIQRMLKLMDDAHKANAKLIVYPEIAPVTFFPRHILEGEELEKYFEQEVDGDITKSPNLKPLFDKAREYKMDVCIGYAECTGADHTHYNTCIYYSGQVDKVVSKYRKVHLPGTFEPYERKDATNQLEKRYFKPGDLGFEAFRAPELVPDALTKTLGAKPNEPDTLGKGDPIVGMIICNDRRWPEAWRTYGLQGVELMLCGYNTTAWAPELLGTNKKISTKEKAKTEALFHNQLSLTYNSYANSCFSINVAKCGLEDGKYPLIGGSCIVDCDGEVVVEASTEDDELIVAEIDLGMCRRGKEKVFAFEKHRRIEHYGLIAEQTGVREPEFL
ncbi:hypothetical protein PV08_02400 [Exophiala spinifera]|uniref:CN hydrolase domain-containing protein n=1 Tax=Exophiala spinifera TaxID=91928 RepID=A0A0D1ZZI0_9EURO|nr:uncharacterized protein PV08_02400 [Exophiala spinifera]KIW18112.1 hypothetical protein PV08_02400 [Exophiala spinifera]